MSDVEFEIGPITERDLGKRNKQHRLGFTKSFGPGGSSTNVEYLTTMELVTLYGKIGVYLEDVDYSQ